MARYICRWTAMVVTMTIGGMAGAQEAVEVSGFSDARDSIAVALPRLHGAIQIDGRLDEPAWRKVPNLPMTMFEPVAGRPPSEDTRIRVAYDDGHLYIGAELGDTSGGPRVNSFTRDRWANDDLLELVLDTYNDNASAVIFGVNPAGTRFDSQVRDDAEFTYGFPIDYSWNAFWDAATRQTSAGWTAEIRIPFSSLRFQPRGGRVTMGLIVSRFIASKNETVTFPAVDPRWNMGFNKPSQAQDVTLDGVAASRPVYVAPYVLAGRQTAFGPDTQGAVRSTAGNTLESGADIRFAPTDNVAVDLTVNTDFAQVEADDQQVNLTRFSLFFPEKRQFFQERSSTFDVRTGGNNRLFHSRRIGIMDGGLVPILGGVRAVGQAGGVDFGVLGIRTGKTELTAAENFFVGRGRRRVVNEFSHVGAMVTSRNAGGSGNLAYGIDGSVRLGETHYVSGTWAQTFANGAGGSRSASGVFMLEDRDRRGLGYRLSASRAGAQFDPGVGFVRRRDYRDVAVQATWGIFANESSPVQRWGPRVEGTHVVRDSDGAFETGELTTGLEAEFKNGSSVRGGVVVTRERLDTPFLISDDASVPAGSYDFVWGRMFATTSNARVLSGSIFVQTGEFFDGRIVQLSFSPQWRLPPHLEIGPEFDHYRVRFGQRGESFVADLARLRLTLSVNTALSADAFVQYSSEGAQWIGNGRLQYQFSEGRTLWIVINDQQFTPALLGDVPSLRQRDRTFVVKYLHTFRAW